MTGDSEESVESLKKRLSDEMELQQEESKQT